MFKHPLSDADPKVLREAMAAMGERRAEEFPELLTKLRASLSRFYPPHCLSVLATYGLQTGVSEDGVADKKMAPITQQFHIELLQALILMMPLDQWSQEPATPNDIQEIIDTVNKLGDAFHQRRFLAVHENRDLQSRTVLTLQERIRIHTQAVRNWGYFDDVVAISRELYSDLDVAFKEKLKFTATDLIAVSRHLVSVVDIRSNERWKLLKRIFRERRIDRLVRRYYADYPNVGGDPEEYIRHVPPDTSLEAVAAKLLSHADLALAAVYFFRPEALAADLEVPPETVTAVLRALSVTPGALAENDPEHFFLSNPTWKSPVIELDGGFYCPTPQSIFSHVHDVMRMLAERAGVSGLLERRRAEYLEEKVHSLLERALPGADLRCGTKWSTGGVEYETDHVAVLDKTVIVVEDKSAALSPAGLRGAPDRVKRHIRELVLAPTEQSARLIDLIKKAAANDTAAKGVLEPFELDFSKTERFVQISVTLDDFSVLCSAERTLKKAGWIPENVNLATTLNVADLQVVTEILDKPSYFVHYFAERGRIQKVLEIVADELDFLGFYLETGMNVWNLEVEKASLTLTGMSRTLDRYYQSRDAGVRLPKPHLKIQPYYASLIEAMEGRRFPGWLNVTADLLRSANFDDQKNLDRRLAKLKANVARNWRDPEHQCCLVLTPPETRETAIVFYAYPPQLASRRKEIVGELAGRALDLSARDRCVVVCRNIERWADPYSFVVIANAAGKSEVETGPEDLQFERP